TFVDAFGGAPISIRDPSINFLFGPARSNTYVDGTGESPVAFSPQISDCLQLNGVSLVSSGGAP
ncbi:hypothetical protein HAX54_009156, partial [Datura stramonium]|nr:hypothetical protein [Datura stramonium]